MVNLVHHLDKDDPGWRERTIIFFDNLAAHKTRDLKELYKDLGLMVFTNAAYSPELNSIETLFGTLKQRLRSTAHKSK